MVAVVSLPSWKLGIVDIVDGVCRVAEILFFFAGGGAFYCRSFILSACVIGLSFALVTVPGRVCSSNEPAT